MSKDTKQLTGHNNAEILVESNSLKQSILVRMPNGDEYDIDIYHGKSEIKLTCASNGELVIKPNVSNQIIIKTV